MRRSKTIQARCKDGEGVAFDVSSSEKTEAQAGLSFQGKVYATHYVLPRSMNGVEDPELFVLGQAIKKLGISLMAAAHGDKNKKYISPQYQ